MAREHKGATYRRIPQTWDSNPAVMKLSPESFRMFWLIRAGTSMGALEGLCRVGPGTLADMSGVQYEQANDCLDEMCTTRAIEYDRNNHVVYIPGAISAFPPENPNQITHLAGELQKIPEGRARAAYVRELHTVLAEKPQWQEGAPADLLVEALRACQAPEKRLPEGLPQPLLKGLLKQDEEEDYDEEKEEEKQSPHPIRILATEKQKTTCTDILKQHGLTIEEWCAENRHDEFGSQQVTAVMDRFRGVTPDPQKAEKRVTDARNTQLANLRLDLERRLQGTPSNGPGSQAGADIREWIDSATSDKNIRQQLINQLRKAETHPAPYE